ncbi:hypothetical protein [Prochlorococcus marinus]|uniref:hypothetical protein n=1 Tax=Prochlorococcus marinus TaxID=1219 RepID=UPI0022B55CA5|nr:hypothetical protein [Prochlorococcus marinus]
MTKTQKAEILDAYKAGDSTNFLAGKYSCSPNTINRTVKTLLTDSEYKLLKKKRSKIHNKSEKLFDTKTIIEKKDIEYSNSLISFKEQDEKEDSSINVNQESNLHELDMINSFSVEDSDYLSEDLSFVSNNNSQDVANDFEEIAPLISSFDFDLGKQKSDFEILNYESLPESVYMIVDKKVELELQSISDLPEWSFLPENELQRNAILLFANQRSAKRICSRSQRVIKVPNTNVFKLSKSYLISKGITRLILEDSIIGLDN